LPRLGSAASALSIFGPSSSLEPEPVMPSDRRMMYSRECPNSWMMASPSPILLSALRTSAMEGVRSNRTCTIEPPVKSMSYLRP
jgi:hypothetical protein